MTNVKLEKSNNMFTTCVKLFQSVCRSISDHMLCVFMLGYQYVSWFHWAEITEVTFLNVENSSSTSTTVATCSSMEMTPFKLINKYSKDISLTIVFFTRSAWLCLWRRVM